MGRHNKTIETKKKSYKKWLNSKKLEDKLVYKRNSTGQKRSKKKTKTLLGQICYKFRTRNVQDRTQSVQNFKTNIEETARIQGNTDENVFLQYYDMLWNTTIIN